VPAESILTDQFQFHSTLLQFFHAANPTPIPGFPEFPQIALSVRTLAVTSPRREVVGPISLMASVWLPRISDILAAFITCGPKM